MNKLKKGFMYLFLTIASLVSLFPFYYMIVSATNKSIDVTRGTLLPGTHLIQNFKEMFQTVDLGTAFLNSSIIAVVTTFFALFIASLAGYGFEIHRSKGKDIIFSILLLSMMIPFASIMIPLFRFFGGVSQVAPMFGIDTLLAAIVPTVTTGFLIFFFRQNTKMFTKDLLEAGRIDGLSEFGLFFRVYMPTMKSTYAAGGIITFMNSWNNFLWPLVVLQSPENRTIPLLISNLGSGYAPNYGVLMLTIVISTIPTALIFFFMQKYFVAGMLGAVD